MTQPRDYMRDAGMSFARLVCSVVLASAVYGVLACVWLALLGPHAESAYKQKVYRYQPAPVHLHEYIYASPLVCWPHGRCYKRTATVVHETPLVIYLDGSGR